MLIALVVVCIFGKFPATAQYSSDVLSTKRGLITLNGRQFIPYGLDIYGLMSPPSVRGKQAQERYQYFMQPGQPELSMAASWKANMIRFQLSQAGLDPKSKYWSQEYLQEIQSAVTQARQAGFVVNVNVDDQDTESGKHRMPTEATLRACLQLTRLFSNDLGVMYELYNEPALSPNPHNWQLWLHGGQNPNGGDRLVGMQTLVNAVRKVGARNLIIVDGLDWARRFEGMPHIDDPGHNMVFGVHPYYASHYCKPSDWQKSFGFLIEDGFPVLASEWNATTGPKGAVIRCFKGASGDKIKQEVWKFLGYLQRRKIGLCVWAFDYPGWVLKKIGGEPTTFDGFTAETPGGGPGVIVRNYFRTQNGK
ncbi:MAG: cellulase family glycosylhydrolase [Candidatus Riflebacteria bacterium]|nr:cellulase family glycosylhydrolase [Candidatus Riflebacteria bacterium]